MKKLWEYFFLQQNEPVREAEPTQLRGELNKNKSAVKSKDIR